MRHYGITGTIRASFAFYNTKDEIDSFIIADSPEIVNVLERMGYDGAIITDVFTGGAPYYQGNVDDLQTGSYDDEEKKHIEIDPVIVSYEK